MSEWCAVAAMLCLSAALACFVSAVFIYDRLNMPVGFWEAQRQAPYKSLPKLVQDNKDRHGLIYGVHAPRLAAAVHPRSLLRCSGPPSDRGQ